MPTLAGIGLFLLTATLMEGFAYSMHRWVMHSRLGWALHKSHHRERTGWFELNDLYAVIFAVPSILLIYGAKGFGWGEWAVWVGAGVAAYGVIYFGFHDVIVHGRIAHRVVPRSRYFRRIVQAHKLHHATESRDGSVSFGFIYAPPVDQLKRALSGSREARVRAPRARSSESTSRPAEKV